MAVGVEWPLALHDLAALAEVLKAHRDRSVEEGRGAWALSGQRRSDSFNRTLSCCPFSHPFAPVFILAFLPSIPLHAKQLQYWFKGAVIL